MRIPVSKPALDGKELAYVTEAIESSWISSTGEFVQRFEEEFARICEAKYALSVCNGTVALHLALLGLDVRPGDEVIVPSLTYVATANAVRYVGAEPVFVDVDPYTWCIDPDQVEQRITARTRGIIPVHLYGNPADMNRLRHIAQIHGLWIVEDAAEAHYARYDGKAVGALGNIGTFSFYGNKILTCGEGGAVVFNDDALAVRLRALRGQGMDPDRRYYHPIVGYNYRLTNLACAILCAQIERGETIMAHRRQIFEWYDGILRELDGEWLGWQAFDPAMVETAPWIYTALFDVVGVRDRVADDLAGAGIETRPLFVPVHRMPPYREQSQRRGEHLPVTDDLSARGLCLPTYPGLRYEDVEEICTRICAVIGVK